MQNAECRISPKAVNCTRCRMQMQNAECRIGPKAGCLSTRCRMQDADAGCGIGLKAVSCTRRTNSLGLILHPAFCILHPAPCRRIHFGADSASCILHSACCTYRVIILGWVLHSALCICILRLQRNTECRISPSMQRQIHAVCVLHATRVRISRPSHHQPSCSEARHPSPVPHSCLDLLTTNLHSSYVL